LKLIRYVIDKSNAVNWVVLGMSRVVREWTLVEEIGRGGMGVVWRARHQYMAGDWAIKVMRPELMDDQESRERFLSEAMVLSTLHHPGIVGIQSPFIQDGQLYMPMEYLTGISLDAALKSSPGPWDPVRSVEIITQVADAVGYAHRRTPPVVHRDLKPLNIQLTDGGIAKVLDFGLARAITDKSMTATGTAVGTPAYMAPEVLEGVRATPRSDIYSLGVILFRMLSGRLPYDLPDTESSLQAVFMAVIRGIDRGLPDVRQFVPGLLPQLAGLTMRMLSRDPGDRPADGGELVQLLATISTVGNQTGMQRAGTTSATEDVTRLGIDLAGMRSGGAAKAAPERSPTPAPTPPPPVADPARPHPAQDADRSLLGINVDVPGAASKPPPQPPPKPATTPPPVVTKSDRPRPAPDADRSLLDIKVDARAPVPASKLAPTSQPVPRSAPASRPAPSVNPHRELRHGRNEHESRAFGRALNDLLSGKKWFVVGFNAVVILGVAVSLLMSRREPVVRQKSGVTAASSAYSVAQTQPRVVEGQPPKGDTTKWILLPGGTFEMGSNNGEDDEKPVHNVTLSAFEIAETEVTVAQYRACMQAGACTAPDTGEDCNWGRSDRDDHPVNCVDWHQATNYAQWVGGRLPTEAEWEYAARSGGLNQEYPWGNEEATCRYAVKYEGGSGCGRESTWPVCWRTAGNTTQGLCDMAGNVYEWVSDWKGDYSSGSLTNPTGPSSGSSRVLRGGSWDHGLRNFRAAFRSDNDPGHRNRNVGLRPARSVR